MEYPCSLALLLVFYFTLIVPRVAHGHSDKDFNHERRYLNWAKPFQNDKAGNTLVAEWTGENAVVSRFVSSCPQDEDGDTQCGDVARPEVPQDGDSYSSTLKIQDIETSSIFYLRMKDGFGNTLQPPSFSFDSSAQSKGSAETVNDDLPSPSSPSSNDPSDEGSPSSQAAADKSDSLAGSSPQAPFGKPAVNDGSVPSSGAQDPILSDWDREEPQTTQDHATISDSPRTKATSSSVASYSSVSQADAIPSATGGTSSSPNFKSDGDNDVPSPQDATLSRAPIPTAAIAVPVSLVGVTLLISLVLSFMRRRSLAAQQEENEQIIDIHRSRSVKTVPSLNTTASRGTIIEDSDIEKAIGELAGGKALSRLVSLRRNPSLVHVPVPTPYRTRRGDVRSDISRMHGRTYDDWSSQVDRSHTSRFSRAQSDRHLGYPSTELVRDYTRSQSFLLGFGRSARRYPRRSNQMRFYRTCRDQEKDGGASPAGCTFPGHLSPPNLSRGDSDGASLRLTPQSHSRQNSPGIRDNQCRH